MKEFNFRSKKTGLHNARIGMLETPRGIIYTPHFYFCATKGTIKGLTMDQLYQLKVSLLLCNTYHLYLRPSLDIIKKVGGLHNFIGWNKPIFTDSGGYQIFSMGYGHVSEEIKGKRQGNSFLLKVTDAGAFFKSYIDGKKIFLGPKEIMEFQVLLGADFVVQLDECTPYGFDYQKTKASLYRSMIWGDQSLQSFKYYKNEYYTKQVIYGVLQGGVYKDLRKISLKYILSRPYFGIAIGGSLGNSFNQMSNTIEGPLNILSNMNNKRPIHLLGIGRIRDILRLVTLGIDTFDCVYPTRLARHGSAIVKGIPGAKIDCTKSIYADDFRPLDWSYPVINESRAYIHHLLKSEEISGISLLTYHNIGQMMRLMSEIRENIFLDWEEWEDFAKSWDPNVYNEEKDIL